MNTRSGNSISASSLAPVCPAASFATTRTITANPAQGCAVRSCTKTPFACFALAPIGAGTTIGSAPSRSRNRNSATTPTTP